MSCDFPLLEKLLLCFTADTMQVVDTDLNTHMQWCTGSGQHLSFASHVICLSLCLPSLSGLEDEEAELAARVPAPADRLKRVRQWAAERIATLEVQRAASEGHALALMRAEAALRQSENELDFLADAQQVNRHRCLHPGVHDGISPVPS